MKKLLIAFIGTLPLPYLSYAQNPIFIPDTLSGTSFNLTVHKDSVQLKPGRITQTFGVNTNKYLGPTLFFKKGDSVNITVTNQIGDTTTMHWHGMHVAAKNDGGPMTMIMDGASWNPKFVVRNNAATYWYHPHMLAKTAEQAIKGDAGFLIVRDEVESALNLPRTYGKDDFPIVVQSFELDSLNQFSPKGMVDSIVLVNGTDTPVVNLPAQVVRLRLLNGSGERNFNFGLTANKVFYAIGTDGGLLQAPVPVTRLRLSPGERAEVLLQLDSMIGQTIFLKSYASELPMGVQGGPTMPMPPGSPLMNSPLNGIDFNILQINVVGQTTGAITAIPTTLVADTPYLESMANATKTIHMTADSMNVMDGPFYFNHNLFDMGRIDYNIPLNNIEIWTLLDSTMVAHPFHIHDVHFYILDRDGVAPPPQERGRKDVVLIEPNETVRFIAKFDDFADSTTPYMYHCHILMHEDGGMMGQFIVTNSNASVANHSTNFDGFIIYPNPVTGQLHISSKDQQPCAIEILDCMGRVHFTNNLCGAININTTNWAKGVYTIVIKNESSIWHKTILVE